MIQIKKENKNAKELEELFEHVLSTLQSTRKLEGQDGAITLLIKRLLELSLDREMDHHLSDSPQNRRNGKGKKNVKTT